MYQYVYYPVVYISNVQQQYIEYQFIDNMSEGTTTNHFRIVVMSVMIISGAINTLTYKFQNKQLVYEGSHYKSFFHPYMQTAAMFFGESLALIVYWVQRKRDPQGHAIRQYQARSEGKIIEFNRMFLLIPALNDLISSTLQYTALNFIPGSVFQMMKGGTIVTTFILSRLFLKVLIKFTHAVGAFLALIGIFIVGLSNFLFSDTDSSTDSGLQVLGYALMLASLLTNGFLYVYEQKLLTKYHLQPLQVVGFQGLFGLGMQAVLITIFSFIPCPFSSEACAFNDSGQGFLQRPDAYFAEAADNGLLFLFIILGFLSLGVFNVAGVTVTKSINALARSICDVTRTLFVWIIGIIIALTAGQNKPNYLWEITDLRAIFLQLFGFIVLLLGNFIYNGLIKIPFVKTNVEEVPLLKNQPEKQQKQGNSLLSLLSQN